MILMRISLSTLVALAILTGCQTTSEREEPLFGEALQAAVEHRKFKVYRPDGYAVLRVYRDGVASWQNPTGWQFRGPWTVEGDRFCMTPPPELSDQGGCWRLVETDSFFYRAVRDSDGLALDWCDMKGIDQRANQRCDL